MMLRLERESYELADELENEDPFFRGDLSEGIVVDTDAALQAVEVTEAALQGQETQTAETTAVKPTDTELATDPKIRNKKTIEGNSDNKTTNRKLEESSVKKKH